MTVVDLDIVAGQTAVYMITIRDEVGGVISLSSPAVKLEFAIKRSIHDQLPVVLKRLGFGIEVVGNGSAGQLELRLQPDDTVELTPGNYEYDLWVTLTAGRFPALRGKVRLLSAVNRAV